MGQFRETLLYKKVAESLS